MVSSLENLINCTGEPLLAGESRSAVGARVILVPSWATETEGVSRVAETDSVASGGGIFPPLRDSTKSVSSRISRVNSVASGDISETVSKAFPRVSGEGDWAADSEVVLVEVVGVLATFAGLEGSSAVSGEKKIQ